MLKSNYKNLKMMYNNFVNILTLSMFAKYQNQHYHIKSHYEVKILKKILIIFEENLLRDMPDGHYDCLPIRWWN